ncbi:hypothetical protein Patl1_30403 [Pistacia atlantica]|uniref:Uncharacterized protein n=1 Tax=Pistacia atlantica TaxID=434234 RepID=A0ACC1AB76_9ROSI|nr:hypothetical protein Patl1_30403 [Pistacia atlantica]
MATVTLNSLCMVKAAPQNRLSSAIIKSPSSLGSVKSISKSFGLRFSPNFKASMAVYKIKLVGPEDQESEFEAPDDTYILDAAENAGVELPYSFDQSDGSFLDDGQMKEGYLLTCVSYPNC